MRMRIVHVLGMVTASLMVSVDSCMVGAYWRYGPSYYDDYDLGPGGARMSTSFGFGPGFYGPGFFGGPMGGLGSLGLLLSMLLSPRTRPRDVHHHHHHYYHEKPGGGYDYQYKKDGPRGSPYGSAGSGRSDRGGSASGNRGFSNFFKNMFYK